MWRTSRYHGLPPTFAKKWVPEMVTEMQQFSVSIMRDAPLLQQEVFTGMDD